MSDVVGSILMVAATLVLTTGFATLLIGGMPGPQEELAADLEASLVQDDCPWGTGDERVQVRHRGGEPLPGSTTRVIVTLDGSTQVFEGAALGGPFTDGSLSIGESWQSAVLTIGSGASVFVDIVSNDGPASLVSTQEFVAPTPCGGVA